ncbi:MAG: hypothetical protein M3P93_18465 [Actinomycetota bacterium]|nr:hypothetical protein [Actinomycetota bacterium]
MTWTRLDDGWSDRPILEQLSYEVRWHYLSLIQFCSRTSRYDGMVRPSDARRCSDVPDSEAAVSELLGVGLLAVVDGGLKVMQIDEHVPPPHLRDEARKTAQAERKRRERQHKKGVHDYCLPDHCEHVAAPVAGEVTRDVGTGQDGTGRENGTSPEVGPQHSPWPTVRRCRVCNSPIDPKLPDDTHPACTPDAVPSIAARRSA